MKTKFKYLFFLGVGYLILWISCFFAIKNVEENISYIFFVFLIIGISLVWLYTVFVLEPIDELKKAINRIINGDIKARAVPKGNVESKTIINEFNVMADEIEANNKMREDFIKTFSHEIRNSVNTIVGYSDLVNNIRVSDKTKLEYCKLIKEESYNLSKVCNNVLMMCKIDGKQIVTNKTVFNLNELIRDVIAKYIATNKGTKEIYFDINDQQILFNGDKTLIRECIYNIIDNAYKYSKNNSTVIIRQTNIDNLINIEFVSEPINKVDIESINRLINNDDVYATNNGIGLKVVDKIIKIHKGNMYITYNDDLYSVLISFNI